MAESERHIALVKSLVDCVTRDYFHGYHGGVLVDASWCNKHGKPPAIGDYVPDVYGEADDPKIIVLGEAKTAADVENRHTREQLTAFLLFCAMSDVSVLVLAVPWHMSRFVRQMVKRLAIQNRAEHVKCVVLDGLEG
jgi:hypothetical protein